MKTADWDDPSIRAIGRRYAAEAYDLASELHSRLVDEQHLDAAGRGGLDLLVLDDRRPDLDHARGSPGRRVRANHLRGSAAHQGEGNSGDQQEPR